MFFGDISQEASSSCQSTYLKYHLILTLTSKWKFQMINKSHSYHWEQKEKLEIWPHWCDESFVWINFKSLLQVVGAITFFIPCDVVEAKTDTSNVRVKQMFSTVHYITEHYSTVHYSTVHYSTVQCSTGTSQIMTAQRQRQEN